MKTRTLFLVAFVFLIIAESLHAQGPLLRTFTKPSPQTGTARFGYAAAGMGEDKLLISAYYAYDFGISTYAGAVYLLNTNGTLLTTFTNPTPANADYFGWAVAAVGTDKVLVGAFADDVGATDSGAAYLFSTNGILLTTFTNPTPAVSDYFGYALAAVGTDKVLVGVYPDDTDATDAGAAYLFSTNGALLTTFTNPAPLAGDYFGIAVAGVGTDKVLIGAYAKDLGATDAGAAYLFSTSGTLLTTFTNPTPATADYFGYPVAALGSDRVLIGAYQDNTGAPHSGAVYLFSTDGTLLTTFTNPTPANGDNFGVSLAALGTDKVLIGAYGDETGASDAGAAYVFNTNGVLLGVFNNPTPANGDFFGLPVVAVGTNRVLIGAYSDDTTGSDVGAAYLFGLPDFRIFRAAANTVVVGWPTIWTGVVLQSNTNLATSNWVGVTNTVNVVGAENQVVFSQSGGPRYFRLSQP